MNRFKHLSYLAPLETYEQHAQELFDALQSNEEASEAADAARWRCKWQHPRFRDQSIAEVKARTTLARNSDCSRYRSRLEL